MAHNEPPHQDLRCLQIQLFSSLVVKELRVHLRQIFLDPVLEASAGVAHFITGHVFCCLAYFLIQIVTLDLFECNFWYS